MTEEEKQQVVELVEKYLEDIRSPEPDPSLLADLWVGLQQIVGVNVH